MTERSHVTTRLALPRDADAITSIARQSLAPHLVEKISFATADVAHHIREQISLPPAFSDTRFIVAEANGETVGFLEFRYLLKNPRTLFWNYQCMVPSAQGRGLADWLFYKSLPLVQLPHHDRIELDATEENVRSRQWLKRLGFEDDHVTEWREVPVPEASLEGVTAHLPDYVQAQAAQRLYGFSWFELSTRHGTVRVGRFGEFWYRLSPPEALLNADALQVLHALEPQRRIAIIMTEEAFARTTVATSPLLRSVRMVAPLERVQQILNEKCGRDSDG